MRKKVTSRQSPVASEASTGVGVSESHPAVEESVRRRDGRAEPRAIAKRGGAGAGRPLRAALITTMLILSACGFTPLHSQAYRAQQAVDVSSLAISVAGSNITPDATATIPRRYSELLKAEIESQVNPDATPTEKLFALTITFNELNTALFVNPDGTASRGDLAYNSTYSLTRLADGKPITSGVIARISSYNSSPTADYASYVSIEDARKRGMMELAQDYKLRLASLLPTLNNPTAPPAPAPQPESVPALQPVRNYETYRSGY